MIIGAVELNGVARRCQSLRLGPRDTVMLNNNLNISANCNNNKLTYNMASDSSKVAEHGDQETKLLMDNRSGCLRLISDPKNTFILLFRS